MLKDARSDDRVRHELDPLLNPRSIALLGASQRPNSTGRALLDMARIDGYSGTLYLVNPRYTEIDGNVCYSSLEALPETVEHVVIGLGNERLETVLDVVIEHGARSATILASCQSAKNDDIPLAARLKRRAEEAGLLLCGGNSLGFYNRAAGLRIAGFASPAGLRKGGIAWIVQSGSALSALAHGDRRLGFTLCVSTGMEMTTTAAQYADWALNQPTTRVIGMFLESVRDPVRFVDMLQAAKVRRIPVVILKVGRTEKSASMALSHTGAIAGSDLAFNAVCENHGVILVKDFGELVATLQLFDRSTPLRGSGLCTMHDSGGEREMLVDLADDFDIPFAYISDETRAKLADNLDVGLVPENPLDAWGTSENVQTRFTNCLSALGNDPGTALVLMCSNPRDDYWYSTMIVDALIHANDASAAPLALVANSTLATYSDAAVRLSEYGIPLIDGTRNALIAAGNVLHHRDVLQREDDSIPALEASVVSALRQKLEGRNGAIPEHEALELLANAGVPAVQWKVITNLDEAIAAAQEIDGYVVLKTAEGTHHKSDLGGVHLGLVDNDAVSVAYRDIENRLGPRAILGPMIESGVEVGLGVVVDSAFGAIVVISAGGTLIEILDDKCAAVAPFGPRTARRLIDRMRLSKILAGVRGKPAVDIENLCNAIARFSVFAATFSEYISEIDINPILVSQDACCAVDALIILSQRG